MIVCNFCFNFSSLNKIKENLWKATGLKNAISDNCIFCKQIIYTRYPDFSPAFPGGYSVCTPRFWLIYYILKSTWHAHFTAMFMQIASIQKLFTKAQRSTSEMGKMSGIWFIYLKFRKRCNIFFWLKVGWFVEYGCKLNHFIHQIMLTTIGRRSGWALKTLIYMNCIFWQSE